MEKDVQVTRQQLLVFDFGFDVFLLVGEKGVFITGALDIGFVFELVQGCLHPLVVGAEVQVEVLDEQHGEVAGGGFELFDVFHEEEGLEHAHGKVVLEVILGDVDGALHAGLEGRPEALEGQVEGNELPQGQGLGFDATMLEYIHQRALPDRAVPPEEGVVAGQVFVGHFEQGKLIGQGGIGLHEVGLVAVAGKGTAFDLDQGLDVVVLLLIQVFEGRYVLGALGEEPFHDDLIGVFAGQVELDFEAVLDAGEVIVLLAVEPAHHTVDVLLRSDDHPGAPLAFGGQGLGDGLEVEHQFGLVGDVLPDLVYQEVDAGLRSLGFQPAVYPFGKGFGGDLVLLLVAKDELIGLLQRDALHLVDGFPDKMTLQQDFLPALLPGFACQLGKGALKSLKLPIQVQVPLQLGDVSLPAVVALHLVEDLDKHRQDGVGGLLDAAVGFLVDVEQDALGRVSEGFLNFAL